MSPSHSTFTERHHVHSRVIDTLCAIHPRVGGFVARMKTGTDVSALATDVGTIRGVLESV
jgi:hypothetical protein